MAKTKRNSSSSDMQIILVPCTALFGKNGSGGSNIFFVIDIGKLQVADIPYMFIIGHTFILIGINPPYKARPVELSGIWNCQISSNLHKAVCP